MERFKTSRLQTPGSRGWRRWYQSFNLKQPGFLGVQVDGDHAVIVGISDVERLSMNCEAGRFVELQRR